MPLTTSDAPSACPTLIVDARLSVAPAGLLANPRIGEKLEEFEPREVRRILVGHYEMRYEIQESRIYVLRLWHTREGR